MRAVAWVDAVQRPALLTPWSLAHLASGVAAAAVARRAFPRAGFGDAFRAWLVLHLAYELKDQAAAALMPPLPLRHTNNNSPLNTAGDQTSAAAGFALAWALRATPLDALAACALLFLALSSAAMSGSGAGTPLWRVWDSRD